MATPAAAAGTVVVSFNQKLDAVDKLRGEGDRVLLLELLQHFDAVSGLHEAVGHVNDGLQDLLPELVISKDSDRPLEDIVAELVRSQALNDVAHAVGPALRAEAELASDILVIDLVRSFEDLVNLSSGLRSLQALFDHIGREFELAESGEVTRDEVENLIVKGFILHFEHVLDKIVAEWALDKDMHA